MIEDVEDEQKLQLAFNIMPMGRSMLHTFALGGQNRDKADVNDHVKARDATELIFKTAQEKIQLNIVGVDPLEFPEGTPFEIPVLPDMYGSTPLDICLAISIHGNADALVFYPPDEEVVI